MGTRQTDAGQLVTGNAGFRSALAGAGAGTGNASGVFTYVPRSGTGGASEITLGSTGYNADTLFFDSSRVARTSSETRPINVAYSPRLHA